MVFLLVFVFGIVNTVHGNSVGTPCPAGHACPFPDGCVFAPTTKGYACICRLANRENASHWGQGFEECTNLYSPWSLYPYENETKVANPAFKYELLPESAFNASGSYPGFKPSFARLRASIDGYGAWCSPADNNQHWLQVDLANVIPVSMIATQGRGAVMIPFLVKTFQVGLSNDGVTFLKVQSNSQTRNFTGNQENEVIVYNFFDSGTTTRYIRVYPLEFSNMRCMRLEVYGEKIINECEMSGWNKCHEKATCTDTISSYYCTCLPGYDDADDDGFLCIEMDECRTRIPWWRHNCSTHAKCENLPGSFLCTCKTGFQGDGVYCEDIDECEAKTAICHEDAFCNNTQSSYECNCKPGYSGNGKECTDVDECKKGTHECHIDAKCENTKGSYTCTCFNGYHGTGFECSDTNECVKEKPCHVDADCSNTKGSYLCRCKTGYQGSGQWCADIDECAENSGGCAHDERCYNYPGGHHCMCPAVMPLQYTYAKLERKILDQVLMNFRNVKIEDWKYPVDYHAHTIRTVYQLVMRTYNYHFIEERNPFYIFQTAGNAFAVELFDLRCMDVSNVTFPNLCHEEYHQTTFNNFSDVVEMWLVRKAQEPFENWATPPPLKPPKEGEPTTTQPPIITELLPTAKIITDANGTNISVTDPLPTRPAMFQCGRKFNSSSQGGTIMTPNYPNEYPSYSRCVWEFEAEERHNIYIEFDTSTFRLENDKSCTYDFVEVRDDSLNGNLLARYCGTTFPTAVRSSRNKLFVIFQSDAYYQYGGFKAKWGILSPRVSLTCIAYNQMSTMPDSYIRTWINEMETEDKTKFVPVSRLLACRQYPQCTNARPGPIIYTFEHFRDDRNEKVCILWDLDIIGATYTTTGCKKRKTNKTHTVCECYTWGIVGVMGRLNPYTAPKKLRIFELGKNSFWSVLLVTLALMATLLFLFLKDQWGAVVIEVFTMKEYDSGRIIQMHIVLSTLLAEIFFSIITFNVTASPGSCYFLAFIFYYLLQTVFFWLFIYTLFLQSRVQEIFDSDKYNSYKIYLFVGYGVPFLVTLTISGLNFQSELDEKLCWLLFSGTTVWGFSGVVVTLGVGTLILLLNIMYNARTMENGIILQEKCLRTMFTTFFVLLTSVFGARALQTKMYYAEYLFSLFNLLQGFSIAVMYCILRREDPIIRSNQVGPIPEFGKNEKQFEDVGDDDVAKFKDMKGNEEDSEEEMKSEEEEQEDGIGEIKIISEPDMRTLDINKSSILIDVPETRISAGKGEENEEATVDEPVYVDNGGDDLSTDSDEDHEIMYRVEENDNYDVRV